MGVGDTVSRGRHRPHRTVSHSSGDGLPRESAEQHRDAIPGRVRVVARVLRCRSIKCPYTRAGAGDDVRAGALERGGPCPRGCRALERGGPCPRER
jgi:hypothetical protein